MPEIRGDSLDVTGEEERYLRGAFRRFALPYLAGLVLLVVGAGALFGGASDTDELSSLRDENAALRAELDAVVGRLDAELGGAIERMGALEQRVVRASGGGESARQLAEVREDLDAVNRRVSSVEASRGAAGLEEVEERVAALEDRFQRLERPSAAGPSDLRAAPYPPASSRLP